ncbi:thiolase family protein (plasmid) [Rhizobium bangladeshense]|uniref:thiolase family protein n=1 Tax=Rhizobium bangladeshense TaxID=1138189 RepID=UPI001A988890|nr:thiolase family protein [Rhizobium bangladeshense]QSY97814.1 thiolase family protein [Rhizobium bangladeshense]
MRPQRSKGAIIGIGELKPMRRTEGVTTLEMLAKVSAAAVADAGIEPYEIDGLLVGPQVGETPQHVPATIAEYLGLRPSMGNVVDLGGASGAGMVWRAAAAIEAGMCETVLCVLGNARDDDPPRSPNRNPIREFDVPFGASGANISYALFMQAHMARYGTRAEDYAGIAHWARHNAQFNENAIFYGKPASVEEILASPLIASPLHLFEIVMPVAGAEAVIVTSVRRARERQQRLVHLLGAGEKITHRAASQAPDLTTGPLKQAIARALAQSGTRAEDMNLLSLYDCYTIMVALTIEDAGLCRPGGFGEWLNGRDLSFSGDTPLNTHGGQLGFGQPDLAGGMTHIVEAVRQLRGSATGRQIKNPQLALVTGNGATVSEATALVLGAD